jgi:hypothetical protein
MSVLNENTIIGASGAGGYEIDNSLRFNDDDTAYLSRTPSSASNQKTWTWSGWVKRGNLSTIKLPLMSAGSSGSEFTMLYIANPTDRVTLYNLSGGVDYGFQTSAVLRDPSAWYHILFVVDTTDATASDRQKVYVNGVRYTDLATNYGDYPLNHDTYINSTQQSLIGKYTGNTQYADGYLSEVNFIDGLALTPDSFGEYGDYGEWKPLKYTGSYGTNGFYLDFKNSGSLGNDAAGSNNWTPTNLAATDQMLDSPTNNFSVMNVLDNGGVTFSDGNTAITGAGSSFKIARSTIGISSGKYYVEFIIASESAASRLDFGLLGSPATLSGFLGATSNGYTIYESGGNVVKYNNNSGSIVTSGSLDVNDVQMLAYDADSGKLWFGKNGSWFASGDPSLGTNALFTGVSGEAYYLAIQSYNTSDIGYTNFGQDSSFAGNKTAQGNSDANGIGDFYYAPPTGFLALCTKNLPEPTVIPSEHFNTVLYSGTSAAQSITGVGFQPDFVWGKSRSYATSHEVVDVIRGTNLKLHTDGTYAEGASSSFSAITSDGFDLVGAGNWNTTGKTYAAWNWKANGAGVSNTDGSINSTVSANVDAGFSIISYTGNSTAGATVGHGLTIPPELVLLKARTNTNGWQVFGFSLFDRMFLNATNADAGNYPITSSSTVLTLSSLVDAAWNTTGDDYIAYAFHSVDGYSKVGSYTGNGSADGPFNHLNFKPAYVMVKRTDAANNWMVSDSSRDQDNVVSELIYANLSNAAYSLAHIDFTSNGFKLRTSNASWNASGGTYIYYAVAESPFKYSNAR